MLIEEAIDRTSQQKLYVQIYNIIKEKIESSFWQWGTRLPSEDELCRIFDVSKATVRIAVSELERQGYLKRRQGKGTFVTFTSRNLGMEVRTRLTEDMLGEGVRVNKEILMKGVINPPEKIRAYLGYGGEVFYVYCKRVVGGETACIEELFLPLALFPGIEDENVCQASLYRLVQEKSSRRVWKVIQITEVTDLEDEAADILKAERGSAALLFHRLLMGIDGHPITYTRLIGSGRKYKIQSEFERIK